MLLRAILNYWREKQTTRQSSSFSRYDDIFSIELVKKQTKRNSRSCRDSHRRTFHARLTRPQISSSLENPKVLPSYFLVSIFPDSLPVLFIFSPLIAKKHRYNLLRNVAVPFLPFSTSPMFSPPRSRRRSVYLFQDNSDPPIQNKPLRQNLMHRKTRLHPLRLLCLRTFEVANPLYHYR